MSRVFVDTSALLALFNASDDEDLHERGLDLLLSRKRRRLSLVDAVSFVQVEAQRLDRAFAFDEHFAKAGFEPVVA